MGITLDELRQTDVSSLSLSKRVEAFYKGTNALRDFAETMIIPVIKGQLKLSDRELAAVGTYYRSFAWIQSLVCLNSRIHFQAVAAAARSLYELQLDLRLIVSDSDGDLVQKFHAFVDVERYRSAKNLVDFVDANPSSSLDIDHQRRLVEIPGKGQAIDDLVEKHWGQTKAGTPNRPSHWSGLDRRSIAKKLGPKYEEKYVDTYSYLSWYSHSGSTGYAGLGVEALESGFGRCHSIAQESFIDSTLALSEVLPLRQGIENLFKIIEDLRLFPGKVIVEEQIKQLDQGTQENQAPDGS